MFKVLAPILALAVMAGAPAAPAVAQPTHLRINGLKPGELVVRIFDAGQGQCVLIECPDDPPILNDCGRMGSGGNLEGASTAVRKRLAEYRAVYDAPFLRVVISHPHLDHYSALVSSGHGFDPNDVSVLYFGGLFSKFSVKAQAWINRISNNVTGTDFSGACDQTTGVSCLLPNQHAFPWDRLSCGAAEIDLLTVNALAHQREIRTRPRLAGTAPNGDSAILRIRYLGASVILPGDGEAVSQHHATENARSASLPLAGTTILLSPHHGSRQHGSNDADWVQATAPATVVFSANEGGGYGHPDCSVIRTFDEARYADGDEMVRADGPLSILCGDGEGALHSQTFVHQFIATEANGDVTVRISQSGLTIGCLRETPACAVTTSR